MTGVRLRLVAWLVGTPILLWVLSHSLTLIGPWTLPLGIILPILGGIGALFSLLLRAKYPHRKRWWILGLLNTAIALEEVRFRDPIAHGTPILTWNVGDPKRQNTKLPCVTSYLKEWTKDHPEGLILLQELNEIGGQFVESELGWTCEWSPYEEGCPLTNWCVGLIICAPPEWTFSRTHHRAFDAARSYGFLQTELQPQKGATFNVLNIHLESLWNTAYQRNLVQNHHQFVYPKLLAKPKLFMKILGENVLTQRQQIAELYDVLEDLHDPVLLVGDFNSVPTMWMHRRMRRSFPSMVKSSQVPGLISAHRAKGWGLGSSAKRLGLPLQIDHLYAQSPLAWTGPTRVDRETTCSDHWPIQAWLSLTTEE